MHTLEYDHFWLGMGMSFLLVRQSSAEHLARIQLNYPQLALCNPAGKSTLTEKLLQRIEQLNARWHICALEEKSLLGEFQLNHVIFAVRNVPPFVCKSIANPNFSNDGPNGNQLADNPPNNLASQLMVCLIVLNANKRRYSSANPF